MSRKILAAIWILILAGFVLTGAARAGELDGSLAARQVPNGADSIEPAAVKDRHPNPLANRCNCNCKSGAI